MEKKGSTEKSSNRLNQRLATAKRVIANLNIEILSLKRQLEEKDFFYNSRISIDDKDLYGCWSVRAYNVLKGAGLMTLGDISLKTEKDILKRLKFGTKTLREIRAVLEKYGMYLMPEEKYL